MEFNPPSARVGCSSPMGLLDGWQYCPQCGAHASQVDGCSTCSACGFQVWAASIPGVQALAVDAAERILLGRRKTDPGRGLWDIPGGFLGEGEDPIAGLKREFAEETGLDVVVDAFLGIWIESYGTRFVHCATWIVRPVGGQLQAGDDLMHVEWFPTDRLPPGEDFAFPTHTEIVSVWAESGSPDSSI
jgi:ADP-ribose pyrophosphatase YjhB (NUDIX family)